MEADFRKREGSAKGERESMREINKVNSVA